jgi:CHASE2 domain-containing sensor protein
MSKESNAKSPPAEYRGLLPAMAGIALYMFVLAGVVGFGAATGRFPRLFLILCVLFLAAAVGLIRLYRWGWALTSAASFLLMSYGVWAYIHTRMAAALVMSFLNLVFFLYLVRPEVRDRLR